MMHQLLTDRLTSVIVLVKMFIIKKKKYGKTQQNHRNKNNRDVATCITRTYRASGNYTLILHLRHHIYLARFCIYGVRGLVHNEIACKVIRFRIVVYYNVTLERCRMVAVNFGDAYLKRV